MIRKRINETSGLESQSEYDFRNILSTLSELDKMIPDYIAIDDMEYDDQDVFEEEWDEKSVLYVDAKDMLNIEKVLEDNIFTNKRIVRKWKKSADSRGVITYTAEFKNLHNMSIWDIEVDFENDRIEFTPVM